MIHLCPRCLFEYADGPDAVKSGPFNGDLDLRHKHTKFLAEIMESFEVKTDDKGLSSGNMVVEISGRGGRPSGINITNAKCTAYMFMQQPLDGRVHIIFENEWMRRHMQELSIRMSDGGDGYRTKMHVIPLSRLFEGHKLKLS